MSPKTNVLIANNAKIFLTNYGGYAKQLHHLIRMFPPEQFNVYYLVFCFHLSNNEPFTKLYSYQELYEECIRQDPAIGGLFLQDCSLLKSISYFSYQSNELDVRVHQINELIQLYSIDRFIFLGDVMLYHRNVSISFQCPSVCWYPCHYYPFTQFDLSGLACFDHIWCLSPTITYYLRQHFPQKTISYVPHITEKSYNTTDEHSKYTLRQKWNVPENAFLILINASLYEKSNRKSIDTQLIAFSQFAKDVPNAFLFLHSACIRDKKIVTPQEFPLELCMEKLQISKDRYYWNKKIITDEELGELYTMSNCVLSCSKSEGFGVPILEAQHYDTYVVTTDFLSMKEHNFQEFIVPVSSPSFNFFQHGEWVDPSSSKISEMLRDILLHGEDLKYRQRKRKSQEFVKRLTSFSRIRSYLSSKTLYGPIGSMYAHYLNNQHSTLLYIDPICTELLTLTHTQWKTQHPFEFYEYQHLFSKQTISPDRVPMVGNISCILLYIKTLSSMSSNSEVKHEFHFFLHDEITDLIKGDIIPSSSWYFYLCSPKQKYTESFFDVFVPNNIITFDLQEHLESPSWTFICPLKYAIDEKNLHLTIQQDTQESIEIHHEINTPSSSSHIVIFFHIQDSQYGILDKWYLALRSLLREYPHCFLIIYYPDSLVVEDFFPEQAPLYSGKQMILRYHGYMIPFSVPIDSIPPLSDQKRTISLHGKFLLQSTTHPSVPSVFPFTQFSQLLQSQYPQQIQIVRQSISTNDLMNKWWSKCQIYTSIGNPRYNVASSFAESCGCCIFQQTSNDAIDPFLSHRCELYDKRDLYFDMSTSLLYSMVTTDNILQQFKNYVNSRDRVSKTIFSKFFYNDDCT